MKELKMTKKEKKDWSQVAKILNLGLLLMFPIMGALACITFLALSIFGNYIYFYVGILWSTFGIILIITTIICMFYVVIRIYKEYN